MKKVILIMCICVMLTGCKSEDEGTSSVALKQFTSTEEAEPAATLFEPDLTDSSEGEMTVTETSGDDGVVVGTRGSNTKPAVTTVPEESTPDRTTETTVPSPQESTTFTNSDTTQPTGNSQGGGNTETQPVVTQSPTQTYIPPVTNPVTQGTTKGTTKVTQGTTQQTTKTTTKATTKATTKETTKATEPQKVKANTMGVDKGVITLNLNDTYKLTATYSPSNAEVSLVWSSNRTDRVTVDGNGNIKAVGAGSAIITVKDSISGLSGSVMVTVKA